MKKIVCTHLFNDFSGSPLVLSTVIKGFRKSGVEVDVITSSTNEGFLSDLEVNYRDNGYKFLNNRILRLVMFLMCQIKMFFQTLKYRNEDVVIYINTLLPFGVAIAGKLIGKKVIYHIHETSVRPAFLKNFLKWVATKTADEAIYVSDFLRKEEGLKDVPSKVIYNALSKEFVTTASQWQKEKSSNEKFVVLMLCSLKEYKGVYEFCALAKALPQINFELVLNANLLDIDNFFLGNDRPTNLTIFPQQSDVHKFYQRANLVVNLSHPEQWVETFGMTLLEGMQYGIPSIAPPVGGPAEIVESGVNGYQMDQREIEKIAQQIQKLSIDKSLYQKLSANAKNMAAQFSVEQMWGEVAKVVGFNTERFAVSHQR